MAATSPVQQTTAAVSTPAGLPTSVVAAASGIEGLGDVSALFTRTRLSSETPTVSHLLKASGIGPYSALGRALTQSIESVNRASGRAFDLNAIYGEFWSIDPSALAALSSEQRAALTAALGELNQALGGEAPAARPAATATDSVERRPTTATAVPVTTPTNGLPAPAATGPQPAGVVRQNGRELPDHAALAGVSRRWQNWFTQGQRPEQTLALLLNRPAERITDISAALDDVTARYGIGQPGRENLEKMLGQLQEGLRAFGYSDRIDGQFGRNTLTAAKVLREEAAPTIDQDSVTNPSIRAYAGFSPLDSAATTPAPADTEAAAATPTVAATPVTTPAAAVTPVATEARPGSVAANDVATPLTTSGTRFGPPVRTVSTVPVGPNGQIQTAQTATRSVVTPEPVATTFNPQTAGALAEASRSTAEAATPSAVPTNEQTEAAYAELRRKLYAREAERFATDPAKATQTINAEVRKRAYDDPRHIAQRYTAVAEVSKPLANAYLQAWLASRSGADFARELLRAVPLATIEAGGLTGEPLNRLRAASAG